MDIEVMVIPGTVPYEGWKQDMDTKLDRFFKDLLPLKLRERKVREPGFVSNGCSLKDCLEYAKRLMQGAPVFLTNTQTDCGLKLICLPRRQYILFLPEEVNIEAINEAKQMYGRLIPTTICHHDFIIPVYTYSLLPGQLHAHQNISASLFPFEREKRTFIDLARFFATASRFPRSKDSYREDSWTKSADATLRRLERNVLRDTDPDLHMLIVSLIEHLHLLDTLPPVLTPLSITRQDVMVQKDTGAITGVLNFDTARTEAFGINISSLSIWIGYHQEGHWRPYDMCVVFEESGWRASEVLTMVFWDELWANMAPGLERKDFEDAVAVALRVGIINHFIMGHNIVLEEPIPTSTMRLMREVLSYLLQAGV